MNDAREGFKFTLDKTFDKQTIQVQNGLNILRGIKEAENHMLFTILNEIDAK